MKLGVVIPVHNGGERLRDVLIRTVERIPAARIFVVDDGSTDNTVEIAESVGVKVLRHSENRGKGEALKTGFNEAIANGFEVVLTLDGDGQHDPADIPILLETMKRTGCEAVLGVRRIHPDSMPFDRVFSNRVSTCVTSFAARRKFSDSQCGFRLWKTPILSRLRIESRRFEIESEMLIAASRIGCRFEEARISTVYQAEPSNMNRVLDTARFCRMIIRMMKD
jgi:glycosyltransferase involved in cell wall biosynthesis